MSYPKALLPSAEGIKRYLSPRMAALSVLVYDTVDSTNTEARRLLSKSIWRPCLLVAHAQKAGKGRLGRSFYSPAGSGLYMTLVYTAQGSAEQTVHVTSAAAVAVCEAISTVCGKEAGIKWVNDLYLDGKKVCGILAETVARPEGHDVILGIGINLTTDDFPDGMRHPAGAVLTANDAFIDQSRLCAIITEKLFDYLDPDHAARCLEGYRARFLLMGRRVICSRNFALDGTPDPALSVEGTVEGVDDDYGLILRLDGGIREVLRGGEISVTLN